MSRANIVFKSRSERERERENDLLKNYREIGIAAIAAAAHKSCRSEGVSAGKPLAANSQKTK